jgi:hypothetical protein
MKRVTVAAITVAILVAFTTWVPTAKHGVPALAVVHAQSGCSDATLNGNYPFTYTGFGAHRLKQTNIPTAAVGLLTFDGTGNATFTYTFVANGVASTTSVPDAGAYTVNSDCSGTMTDATTGIHFNLETVGGGAEIFGIQTDAGSTNTFDAKKQ